jgi:type IV pilus assembly protein PilV
MQKGFTLVEVLVALIVISIGLLGIAKMQALSLASTGTARMRSVAAIEAASMASMMHANRTYWAANTSAVTVTVTLSASPPYTSSDSAVTTPTDCSATAPCNPTQLAGWDLSQWVTALNQTMPLNTTATITCSAESATAPVSCTLQVNWTENLVDVNTGENTGLTAAQNTSALQNATQNTAATHFLLYVEP